MTLLPSKIGDKNQRYEIQTLDWPAPDGTWQAAGWSNSLDGAKAMAEAFMLHPSVLDARYIDRWV